MNINAIDPWNVIGWIVLTFAVLWTLFFACVSLLNGINHLRDLLARRRNRS